MVKGLACPVPWHGKKSGYTTVWCLHHCMVFTPLYGVYTTSFFLALYCYSLLVFIGFSGSMNPGLNAIMGPSGSGKTS